MLCEARRLDQTSAEREASCKNLIFYHREFFLLKSLMAVVFSKSETGGAVSSVVR